MSCGVLLGDFNVEEDRLPVNNDKTGYLMITDTEIGT